MCYFNVEWILAGEREVEDFVASTRTDEERDAANAQVAALEKANELGLLELWPTAKGSWVLSISQLIGAIPVN